MRGKSFKGWVHPLLIVTPMILAALWTFLPALNALFAAAMLQNSENQILPLHHPPRQLKRNIQNHFRKYNVYVPVGDIVAVWESHHTAEHRTVALMREACGTSRIYVWVPIRFRIPIAGERVVEWCWTPRK